MEIICLETEAFYSLIEEVVSRIREKDNLQQDKWVQAQEVMEMLGIKSKSTLQKLRDEGKIQGCTRPITLMIDMSGSSDQDEDLGGFITDYKITIDDTEYTGEFKPDNPILTINNGQVSYTKSSTGPGTKTYSVIHETNTEINIELKDDDGQWSEVEVIKVPAYPE